MCRAKELRMLTTLGMRLAGQNEHRAAQTLLALALRRAINIGSPMLEAKACSNIALALHMAGRKSLAKRQTKRAMHLTAQRVGTNNSFYQRLQANLETPQPAPAHRRVTLCDAKFGKTPMANAQLSAPA